jgi:hypothetical protein
VTDHNVTALRYCAVILRSATVLAQRAVSNRQPVFTVLVQITSLLSRFLHMRAGCCKRCSAAACSLIFTYTTAVLASTAAVAEAHLLWRLQIAHFQRMLHNAFVLRCSIATRTCPACVHAHAFKRIYILKECASTCQLYVRICTWGFRLFMKDLHIQDL